MSSAVNNLFRAIYENDASKVNQIIIEDNSRGDTDRMLVNTKSSADQDGMTPLVFAAARGALAVVETLLRLGADMTITDSYGETPLAIADHQGHRKVTDLLFSVQELTNAGYAQHLAIDACTKNGNDIGKALKWLQENSSLKSPSRDSLNRLKSVSKNGSFTFSESQKEQLLSPKNISPNSSFSSPAVASFDERDGLDRLAGNRANNSSSSQETMNNGLDKGDEIALAKFIHQFEVIAPPSTQGKASSFRGSRAQSFATKKGSVSSAADISSRSESRSNSKSSRGGSFSAGNPLYTATTFNAVMLDELNVDEVCKLMQHLRFPEIVSYVQDNEISGKNLILFKEERDLARVFRLSDIKSAVLMDCINTFRTKGVPITYLRENT